MKKTRKIQREKQVHKQRLYQFLKTTCISHQALGYSLSRVLNSFIQAKLGQTSAKPLNKQNAVKSCWLLNSNKLVY